MNKEQTKKLILGGMGLCVLLFVYFTFFIGPLNRSRAATTRKIADIQGKIASSKNEIAKTARTEENARAALSRNAALRSLSPEGAAIAWFPPRIKTFFAGQQIERVATRLESSGPLKDEQLSRWTRYNWVIDLPQADFEQLGRALASLENTEPLLSITRLHIHSLPQEPAVQQVTLTATTLIATK
jgi:hypothetical protein